MRNIGPTLQINHSACRKVFHSMDVIPSTAATFSHLQISLLSMAIEGPSTIDFNFSWGLGQKLKTLDQREVFGDISG